MASALVATLGRPDWWSMALAGFLVRGGIFLILLPIIAIPTPAALATLLAPSLNALVFGGLTAGVVIAIVVAVLLAVLLIAMAGLSGAWLDRAQLREAGAEDELELGWSPLDTSLREALSLRLTAHLPTLAALSYAAFRLIGATYDELLSPGSDAVPIVLRVIGRAPEAVVLLVLVWLVGETVGGLAARRAAAGLPFGGALRLGARDLVRGRALATLAVTTAALLGALVPFLVGLARAWGQLRDALLAPADPVLIGAALLVLVAAWILGLAVIGAALAWRVAAWTAVIMPPNRPQPGGASMPQAVAEA
jgi:hypothetical protein